MNTIEGNKIIANSVFSNLTYDDKNKVWEDKRNAYGLHSLQYHSSFDWLMPVVFKIREIELSNNKASCVRFAFTVDYKIMTIETIWQAVIKFIQWYNTQNN